MYSKTCPLFLPRCRYYDNGLRDIALAFGVPGQLIGLPDAQTYANFEQARLAFYEETVLPQITRVIAGFDHFLCPMYRDAIELDYDPDSISALTDKRQAQWTKIQNAGFLTRNEKRQAAGYGPVPGGDDDDEGGDSGDDDDGAKFNPYHDELGRFTFAPGGDANTDAPKPTSRGIADTIGNAIQAALGVGSAEAAEVPTKPNNAVPSSWANPDSLADHFERHASDFEATSPQDYADQANQFYQRFQEENLPAVTNPDGITRVYDPITNSFGSYNSDGTTRTYFKPDTGMGYYLDQVEKDVSQGGRVINNLPDSNGSAGKPGFYLFSPHEIEE